jgi:hypothetical protein
MAGRVLLPGCAPNLCGMTRKPRSGHVSTQTTSLPRFVGVDAIVGWHRLLETPTRQRLRDDAKGGACTFQPPPSAKFG